MKIKQIINYAEFGYNIFLLKVISFIDYRNSVFLNSFFVIFFFFVLIFFPLLNTLCYFVYIFISVLMFFFAKYAFYKIVMLFFLEKKQEFFFRLYIIKNETRARWFLFAIFLLLILFGFLKLFFVLYFFLVFFDSIIKTNYDYDCFFFGISGDSGDKIILTEKGKSELNKYLFFYLNNNFFNNFMSRYCYMFDDSLDWGLDFYFVDDEKNALSSLGYY